MTDPHTPASPDAIGRTPPAPSVQLTGQEWLRQLDWRQFEELIGATYRRQGYTVLPTAPGADGGIDLILARGTERIFVQCKHWKAWQVGAPVIRELFGLVAAHRASRGIVVTSGTFSREAVAFARQSGTELVDGPAVLAMIASGNAQAAVATAQPPFAGPQPSTTAAPAVGATLPRGVPSCPVCLSPMQLRKARRGARRGSMFWGCSRFPGCRGSLDAVPGSRPSQPQRAAARSARQPARRRREFRTAIVGLAAVVLGTFALTTFVPAAFRMAAVGVPRSPVQLVPSHTSPSRTSPARTSAVPAEPDVTPQMGEQPMDLVVDGSGERLYTANYTSGDVSVIDTRTMKVIASIDVPGKPVGIAMSGSKLYVADRAGRKVHVVNVKTGKTVASFRTGRLPSDVAVDAKAGRLFVANGEAGTVWAYALDTGKRVSTLAVGRVESLAADSSEHTLHVNAPYGTLTSYRSRTLERTTTSYVGSGGVAVDPKRQRLYVAGSSGLREYNVVTGGSRRIALDIEAKSVSIDPSARMAYVADPDTNAVQAVSVR